MTGLMIFWTYAIMIGGGVLCVISASLSFLLFKDISQDTTLQFVWGGAAFAFELIKFSLVPIGTHHYVKGNKDKAFWLGIGFLVLMLASTTASIGSLAKSTNEQDAKYYAAMDAKLAKENEVQSLRTQVEIRNESIKVFQKEELITNKANPLQAKNDESLAQISILNAEIDLIEIPPRSALAEGISSLSTAFGLSKDSERESQSYVFAGFSIVLEIFAAVALMIGESVFLNRKKSNLDDENKKDLARREEEERKREHAMAMKKLELEGEKFAAKNRAPKITVPDKPAPAVEVAEVISIVPKDNIAQVQQAIKDEIIPNPPTTRSLVKILGMDKDEAEKVIAQI